MRNEAYLSYAAVMKDAEQRRYWTFYEVVKIDPAFIEVAVYYGELDA